MSGDTSEVVTRVPGATSDLRRQVIISLTTGLFIGLILNRTGYYKDGVLAYMYFILPFSMLLTTYIRSRFHDMNSYYFTEGGFLIKSGSKNMRIPYSEICVKRSLFPHQAVRIREYLTAEVNGLVISSGKGLFKITPADPHAFLQELQRRGSKIEEAV